MSHIGCCQQCDWSGTIPDTSVVSLTARWGAGEADELVLVRWECPRCGGANEDLIRDQDFRNGD